MHNMTFLPSNKLAETWPEEEAIALFERIRECAKDKETLSVQAAFRKADIYSSTFYYLIDKYPVLGSLKKDIDDLIIENVNHGAMTGDYVPAPAIWRMKQLGEKDSSQIDHTNAGGKFDPPKITFNE
jgi:hypothetical protein